jgi:hypothetical protein
MFAFTNTKSRWTPHATSINHDATHIESFQTWFRVPIESTAIARSQRTMYGTHYMMLHRQYYMCTQRFMETLAVWRTATKSNKRESTGESITWPGTGWGTNTAWLKRNGLCINARQRTTVYQRPTNAGLIHIEQEMRRVPTVWSWNPKYMTFAIWNVSKVFGQRQFFSAVGKGAFAVISPVTWSLGLTDCSTRFLNNQVDNRWT